MKASSRTTRNHVVRMAAMMAIATTIATTGCAARQEVVLRDDSAITKDVRDRIGADPASSQSKIGVDTKGGVVSLSGVVTEGVRSSAEQIARATPGVRSVDNNMRFGEATPTN